MKSDLQAWREKALFILLVEHLSGANKYVPVAELNQRYNAKIPDQFLHDSFLHWEKAGFAKIYRSGGPFSARLRREAFGDAYEKVLAAIGATTLTITPDLREVFADIEVNETIPLPNGWKWFTLAPNKSENESQTADRLEPASAATTQPVQIINNFSPSNTFAPSTPTQQASKISWSGWLGAAATVASILVALWLAGKF